MARKLTPQQIAQRKGARRTAEETALTVIDDIAKREFRVETLELRHSDSLDFYDVSVWQIKDALMAAYQAGQKSMASGSGVTFSTPLKNKATLTAEEDAAWENTFCDAINSGMSEAKADAFIWAQMQDAFPRLRQFDGCTPKPSTDDIPMPWCDWCQCYHSAKAEHIKRTMTLEEFNTRCEGSEKKYYVYRPDGKRVRVTIPED